MPTFNRSTEVVLPPELQTVAPETVQEIHAEWSAKSADTIRAAMPESRIHDTGVTGLRYVELKPANDDFDPDQTGLLPLPSARVWEPGMYVWSEIVRQIALPKGRLLVLPHNNLGSRAYNFTKTEKEAVAGGDLGPLAERYLRLCDRLGVDSVELVAGRSFGATVGAAFVSRAVGHVHAKTLALDEAPNTYNDRSAIDTIRSLLREGGEVEKAQDKAGLPVYSELMRGTTARQTQWRVARYLLGQQFTPPNPSINHIFQGDSFLNDVASIVGEAELTGVSLSNAAASKVCDIEATGVLAEHLGASAYMSNERIRHIVYEGYHATAGNPFVMGLLARDAMQWYDQELSIPDHDFDALEIDLTSTQTKTPHHQG